MNEVQVYEVQFSDQYGKYEIQPRGICGYEPVKVVRLEEYTALQQQLTATTNSLTNAQEALKSAGIEADTVQAGVKELVSRMNQVVTEMSAMAESRNRLGEFILEEIDSDYPLNMELETPATDAYLNAVRAEALCDFAKEADKKAEAFSASARATNDFSEDQRFRFAAAMFRGFARQLRAAQLRAGNPGKDGSHE